MVVAAEAGKLNLNAVDTVDAVYEENENEDESNLDSNQWHPALYGMTKLTFMPYCSFATIGLSEIKVKSLRRQVNGSGTMRAQKMSISVTRRRKT